VTHELNQRLTALAGAWIVLGPLVLLALALLIWGRAALPLAAIRRGLLRTIGATALLAFPAAWCVFTLCARFNPVPVVGPAQQGLWWAGIFLPVYSVLVACVAFEFVLRDASKANAPARPRWLRLASEVTLGLLALASLAMLVAACLLAAGPRAFG
jgi:hypothetical protein